MSVNDSDRAKDGISVSRRLFMVLSPRSLPYARLALESLFKNSEEQFDLFLITDEESDKQILLDEIKKLGVDQIRKRVQIFGEADLSARESEVFAAYPNIVSFR